MVLLGVTGCLFTLPRLPSTCGAGSECGSTRRLDENATTAPQRENREQRAYRYRNRRRGEVGKEEGNGKKANRRGKRKEEGTNRPVWRLTRKGLGYGDGKVEQVFRGSRGKESGRRHGGKGAGGEGIGQGRGQGARHRTRQRTRGKA